MQRGETFAERGVVVVLRAVLMARSIAWASGESMAFALLDAETASPTVREAASEEVNRLTLVRLLIVKFTELEGTKTSFPYGLQGLAFNVLWGFFKEFCGQLLNSASHEINHNRIFIF